MDALSTYLEVRLRHPLRLLLVQALWRDKSFILLCNHQVVGSVGGTKPCKIVYFGDNALCRYVHGMHPSSKSLWEGTKEAMSPT